jgi:hypothetical protein
VEDTIGKAARPLLVGQLWGRISDEPYLAVDRPQPDRARSTKASFPAAQGPKEAIQAGLHEVTARGVLVQDIGDTCLRS